jgi:hypothetical protein
MSERRRCSLPSSHTSVASLRRLALRDRWRVCCASPLAAAASTTPGDRPADALRALRLAFPGLASGGDRDCARPREEPEAETELHHFVGWHLSHASDTTWLDFFAASASPDRLQRQHSCLHAMHAVCRRNVLDAACCHPPPSTRSARRSERRTGYASPEPFETRS